MVWMIHTSSNTFQQNEADIIAEMIDYAQENGIQVVTAEYAVEHYLEE